MRPPKNTDLLDAWDCGAQASNAQRALLLLGTFQLEPTEQLAKMPLGWVMAQLLEFRGALVGSTLECLSDCAQCGATVESEVPIGQLTAIAVNKSSRIGSDLLRVNHEGYEIKFRLPTCGDLLTLRGDLESAARGLAYRLIVCATRFGDEIAPTEVPAGIHRAIEKTVLENDPLVQVELAVECPGCGHRSSEVLDIVDFVWRELSVFAQRLLSEVARLAHAFGWTESDILAMSENRRRRYLELCHDD